MPAKSRAQQMAAGTALAAKRGEKDAKELEGPAKSMYIWMRRSWRRWRRPVRSISRTITGIVEGVTLAGCL